VPVVGRIRAHDLTDEPTAPTHTQTRPITRCTQADGTSIITPAIWYGYGVGHRRRTCGEPDHLCRVDPGQEQRREATYCVSQSQARPPHGARDRSIDGWLAGARPSLVSCVVRTGEPQRTGSLSGSPGCRVNQQQLGTCSARSIITARGLALH
jgi:hypothetical protein